MRLSKIKPAEPLSGQTYTSLRKAISTGVLKPGEKITERGLAAKLGVSSTPVREALKRLEHEGLIERKGPKSIFIAGKSETEIAEIAYIEAILLGVAARFAARKITEVEIQEMQNMYKAALAKMDSASGEELLEIARQFHAVINRISSNDVLVSFLETVETFDRSHRLRSLNAEMQYRKDYLKISLMEHKQIFDALKARDGERAGILMMEHSLRTSRVFFKHLNDRAKFG